jgi:hypothetical protein
MIPKNLNNVSFDDLRNLIENEIRESRTIEYKSELPNDAESSKKLFLAEVCSFANTDGGDIIYGIREDKGIPIELAGLNIEDPDKEILRIESSILSGLEPRISSFSSKVIKADNKIFITLRIGKSWNAPHMVTFKDHCKFYKRNSAGKYPMDVSEIRMAFLQSEQIADKIRDFKNKRIQKIKTETEMPIKVSSGGKMVLHLVPLSAFAELKYYQITQNNKLGLNLLPLGAMGCNYRYNLDGLLTYSENYDESNDYTQLFRNGIIETVSSFVNTNDKKIIPSVTYEKNIIKATKSYLEALHILEINSPFYFFISMLDIKSYNFAVNIRYSNSYKSDRDDLILPEGIIEDFDVDLDNVFHEFFDMVWNAFGCERSYNYDDNGKWVGQR